MVIVILNNNTIQNITRCKYQLGIKNRFKPTKCSLKLAKYTYMACIGWEKVQTTEKHPYKVIQ